MAEGTEDRKPHVLVEGSASAERYRTPPRAVEGAAIPPRDRPTHGARLLGQLQAARLTREEAREEDEGLDLQLEFESFPDVELAFESLARERSGIELLNVRHDEDEGRTFATVYVPDGKLVQLEKLLQDYLDENRDSAGRRRDHAGLVNAIREIRAGSLRALWTDDVQEFPRPEEGPVWWEVWLPIRGNRVATLDRFRRRASLQGMTVPHGEIAFPERTVVLVHASVEQMQASIMTLNSVAELRRPHTTAEFFDELTSAEQAEWLDDLLDRTTFTEDEDAPHVCLLDTGVNRGHPLIEPALAPGDLHTVEPAWGVQDDAGHGTEMAGLALLGNLTPQLESAGPIVVDHRLESVKLLPHDGSNGSDPILHGHLTTEAVARAEVSWPLRNRVIAMAVTARESRDRGRPSAWSAAVDRLASDGDAFGANPRLLVASAGNVVDQQAWGEYPHAADSDQIHDPAQAWNALTVGASTELVEITDPDAKDYAPIAQAGGLSPFSTTSLTWKNEWPLKPDVVMEGGNAAKDSLSAVSMSSLSLLTTHHEPEKRLFTTSRATSAAAAQTARMACQVAARYPHLWPETIRGLVVHSAEWTDQMKSTYLPGTKKPTKNDFGQLVRRVGFGIPDLEAALWSASNSLTLIVQESLHPFEKQQGQQPRLREMHLHDLPWPREALEALGETEVEMRVTLSYFIEPNPSARGRSRYRYESHGLRFDVRRPMESVDAFRARINAEARDAETGTTTAESDSAWILGKQLRHRGSLHSDRWQGAAVALASRDKIAVVPTVGWWRSRPSLERVDSKARYALIVSIEAPEVETDLYAEVAAQVGIPVEVEV